MSYIRTGGMLSMLVIMNKEQLEWGLTQWDLLTSRGPSGLADPHYVGDEFQICYQLFKSKVENVNRLRESWSNVTIIEYF